MTRSAPFRSAPVRRGPRPPIIIVTGALDASARARLMKLGAHRVIDAADPELLFRHLLAAFADCRHPCCAPSESAEARQPWGRR